MVRQSKVLCPSSYLSLKLLVPQAPYEGSVDELAAVDASIGMPIGAEELLQSIAWVRVILDTSLQSD